MSKAKRLTSLVICLSLVLVTLAGCKPSEPPVGEEDGKTLVYAMMVPPITLDPPNIEDSGSPHVAIQVTEPLVMLGPDNQLRPWLAESWEPNEDASVWTVKLREGVTFSDGTAFDADAVKFTFDRAVDPDKPTKRRARLNKIQEVKAVDAHTVEFVLTQPYSALPFVLTDSSMLIVSPKAVEEFGDDIASKAVGTGPFIVEEFVSNQQATLVRNPSYWQQVGNVERIEVKYVPEYSTRQFMLEKGEANLVQDIAPQDMETLDAIDGVSTLARSSFRQSMVSINTQDELFKDKRVRQALNYAIDKEAIVKYLLSDAATVNDSPVPPSVDGYVPVGAYEYNPDKARELLTEAGYPNGFEANFWGFTAGGDFMNVETVEQIQSYLAEVGINIKISEADTGAQIERTSQGPEESVAQGKHLMWLGGPASRGIQDFLESFYIKEKWAPNGGNRGFYYNPRVEELVSLAGRTGDAVARQELYEEAQQIVMDECPWIFLHTISLLWGHTDNVEGLEYLANDLVLFRNASFTD